MQSQFLNEPEGYALLRKYGIPVPAFHVAHTPDEAATFADEIGYPVIMKIISPEIIHKTDAGGVHSNITTREDAISAFHSITDTVRQNVPGCRIEGIMVEEERKPGFELIIGGKIDPGFGRVISVGLGGIVVELFRDISLGILPLDDKELLSMIRSVRSYPLIAGYRKQPPLDENALFSTLKAAVRLFQENPEIMEFDINPFLLYSEGGVAVDARFAVRTSHPENTEDRDDSWKPADPSLFSPRCIALIGATTDPNKLGYAILRNLLSFKGRVYPVNPHGGEVFGREIHTSIGSIPDHVDTVVIAVPAGQVPGVMKDAGEAGIACAIIISAGFRETGTEGASLENEINEVARRYDMRIVGPNCLGIMLPYEGLNATFDPSAPIPGHIAFISQSGAIITTTVDWGIIEEIGLSAVISVGNQADLTFEDYIHFAGQDPATKAIVLYIEEIRNGSRFLEYARQISEKKPLIALKAGKSQIGIESASSHTGSLAGSYEVYQAAFRQSGVMMVHSLREAFGLAGLLASEGYPAGKRAVVVSSAGGFAVLSSDYAEENGIELIRFEERLLSDLDQIIPSGWGRKNPIDMRGDAGVDRYAKIFDVLIRYQEEWDIVFVVSVPTTSIDPVHLANEIVRFSTHTHKMVVGCLLGGESMKAGVRVLKHSHIPNFSEIEDAFRTVGIAIDRQSDK